MRKSILKILSNLRPEFDFSDGINFIEEGFLDSFDIITLVTELDQHFSISIEGIDIIPENFCNIDSIEFLLRKCGVRDES
ncbi:acyl carrier protein [Desulfosporosinus sp. FKA]|uniref:acyl carrier protein n=1 Tax=Desulfosporosinus sp. FKA TaxID=1969834 RepID=UPI000B49FD11|nr:acyl carrier protein [Desulfosporosinus sp. FKA]